MSEEVTIDEAERLFINISGTLTNKQLTADQLKQLNLNDIKWFSTHNTFITTTQIGGVLSFDTFDECINLSQHMPVCIELDLSCWSLTDHLPIFIDHYSSKYKYESNYRLKNLECLKSKSVGGDKGRLSLSLFKYDPDYHQCLAKNFSLKKIFEHLRDRLGNTRNNFPILLSFDTSELKHLSDGQISNSSLTQIGNAFKNRNSTLTEVPITHLEQIYKIIELEYEDCFTGTYQFEILEVLPSTEDLEQLLGRVLIRHKGDNCHIKNNPGNSQSITIFKPTHQTISRRKSNSNMIETQSKRRPARSKSYPSTSNEHPAIQKKKSFDGLYDEFTSVHYKQPTSGIKRLYPDTKMISLPKSNTEKVLLTLSTQGFKTTGKLIYKQEHLKTAKNTINDKLNTLIERNEIKYSRHQQYLKECPLLNNDVNRFCPENLRQSDIEKCMSIKATTTCELLKKLNELIVDQIIIQQNEIQIVSFNYQDIEPETLEKLKLIFGNTYKNYFHSQSQYLNFNQTAQTQKLAVFGFESDASGGYRKLPKRIKSRRKDRPKRKPRHSKFNKNNKKKSRHPQRKLRSKRRKRLSKKRKNNVNNLFNYQ